MSDPMAEDTIEDVIFDIEDYIGGNVEDQETIDRMGLTVFLRRTINTYTTNKIIEARIDELNAFRRPPFTDGVMALRAEVNDYATNRIAELKALNHRSNTHGDSK